MPAVSIDNLLLVFSLCIPFLPCYSSGVNLRPQMWSCLGFQSSILGFNFFSSFSDNMRLLQLDGISSSWNIIWEKQSKMMNKMTIHVLHNPGDKWATKKTTLLSIINYTGCLMGGPYNGLSPYNWVPISSPIEPNQPGALFSWLKWCFHGFFSMQVGVYAKLWKFNEYRTEQLITHDE